MSAVLTSWKEIAQHLGKGVRTVQRWELCMGLPVRRPMGRVRGMVLSYTDELDAWMQTRFKDKTESELDTLRRRMNEVKKENEVLRLALQAAVMASGSIEVDRATEDLLWRRCSLAVERSAAIRLRSAELLDLSKNLREVRSLQSASLIHAVEEVLESAEATRPH